MWLDSLQLLDGKQESLTSNVDLEKVFQVEFTEQIFCGVISVS